MKKLGLKMKDVGSDSDLEGGELAPVKRMSILEEKEMTSFLDKKQEMEKEVKVGFELGTIFGGILTILIGVIMLQQGLTRLISIYQTREHVFSEKKVILDEEELPKQEITLGKFNNSLNFAFGVVNYDEDFDILDNPYVEFVAYSMNNGNKGQLRLEERYKLDRCTDEFLERFVEQEKLSWYP